MPDARWDWLVQYHKPASKVPAFLNVVDIAGLVKVSIYRVTDWIGQMSREPTRAVASATPS